MYIICYVHIHIYTLILCIVSNWTMKHYASGVTVTSEDVRKGVREEVVYKDNPASKISEGPQNLEFVP